MLQWVSSSMSDINWSIFLIIFSFTLLRRKVKVYLIEFDVFIVYLRGCGEGEVVKESFDFFISLVFIFLILKLSTDSVMWVLIKYFGVLYSSSPLSILVCSLIAYKWLASERSLMIVTGFLLLILIFFLVNLSLFNWIRWAVFNFRSFSFLLIFHLCLC